MMSIVHMALYLVYVYMFKSRALRYVVWVVHTVNQLYFMGEDAHKQPVLVSFVKSKFHGLQCL